MWGLSAADCLLAASAAALLLWAWWSRRQKRAAEERGLEWRASRLPYLGDFGLFFLGLKTAPQLLLDLYERGDGVPMYFTSIASRKIVVVRDPEVIREVMVKAFDHFTDHREVLPKGVNVLLEKNLFSLKGSEWRDMRATLSPAFTSSKMRKMFQLIDVCGQQAVGFVEEKIAESGGGAFEADAKDLFSRVATDVIATAAFGLRVDSLRQQRNAFHENGRDLTAVSGARALLLLGHLLCPKLLQLLDLSYFPNRVLRYFHGIVHETIRERQAKGIVRPDMLQLLMQAREGKLKADKADEHEAEFADAKKSELTDEDITAQAAIFFFAGFDTVSTLLSYVALALALHSDVQQRLQREIDEVLADADGTPSYETVHNIKYLDMVICEVQRLYTSLFMDRKCVRDWTFPGRDGAPPATIRAGDEVWVAQFGLHRDPVLWPDPLAFDPDRFSDENKANVEPFSFIPFGVGPRACIGSRFALMEVKTLMVHLLRNFSFVKTPKTPDQVKYAKFDFTFKVAGGFWVGLARRES